MKAEVAHFTTEQMVDMVGLLSPCMDDYLYVCDFKEDYYQISPNAVKRFCLPADHFHNVVEMHRQVVYPDDLDLLLVELAGASLHGQESIPQSALSLDGEES